MANPEISDFGIRQTGFLHGYSLEQMLKDAETPVILTGFGELVCPHCDANVTAVATKVGTVHCPVCKKPFDVPKETVERFNSLRFDGSVYCLLSGKNLRAADGSR